MKIGLSVIAALGALLLPGAAASATFDDPARYCAAVGTIDRPDQRYTGEAVPEWMARALKEAAHAPTGTPLAEFKRAAWRCADGQVLACLYGANIPCDEKADTRPVPSPGALRFCERNPAADVVPAYAAGRATIFEWRCGSGRPVIVRQALHPDAQGFAREFWSTVSSARSGASPPLPR